MARIRRSADSGFPRRSAASMRTLRAVGAGSTSQAREATSQVMLSCRSRSPAWPACSAAEISAAARGDLFMRAADQRRAMPDTPVRLGAQHLGERLVHPAALQQARALAYR